MPSIVKKILFCTVSVLLFNASNSQDNKKQHVKQIRKIYEEANAYKQYKLVSIDDAETFLGHATDNGASLKGYFKNDTLKKIVEWIGLSNKFAQNEYYLQDGKLVFVFSTEGKYKFDKKKQEFDYSELEPTFTGRYYFHNDEVIEQKQSEKLSVARDQSFSQACKAYTKLLSNRNKGSKNDE